MKKSRIEELMEMKEAADERAARRTTEREAAVEEIRSQVLRALVLPILDEIEASDDPKAKVAEIRKRVAR
jgi:hypothetical protein